MRAGGKTLLAWRQECTGIVIHSYLHMVIAFLVGRDWEGEEEEERGKGGEEEVRRGECGVLGGEECWPASASACME